MSSFKKDLQLGLKSESNVFNILKRSFPDIKSTNSSCIVDYISNENKLIFELKTRNCYKNTYPTTIVGNNKLIYADKHKEYTLILLFKFIDGLFYCKYDQDLEFQIEPYVRNARTDYIDKKKDYVFIPLSQLKSFGLFKENDFNNPRLSS